MMTGLLLARRGVEVVVLEKHRDFLRDFRGDTIHPSTMKIMEELGLIDRFLQLPHSRMSKVTISAPDGENTFADFSLLPPPFNYVAFMPQWDFLDFIAEEASAFPSFSLIREADVRELLIEGDRAVGVRYCTANGEVSLHARLVIGADGRDSTVRTRAWLPPTQSEAPMDVLWFRVSREPSDEVPFVSAGSGYTVVSVNRGSYWQIAYCIPKGEYDRLQSHGIGAMAERVESAIPALSGRFEHEVQSWDDLNLLSVSVNHLRRWHRPGLLCIGDAAHAMSPAGGVGINLAVQDAVATGRLLSGTLSRHETPSESQLAGVQRRREWAARVIQAGQVRILADLYPKSFEDAYSTPTAAKVIRKSSFLQKTVARVIGLGLRPEHL